MRIEINPAYKQFSSFVEGIPDRFNKEGVTIYKGRNEIKVFEVDGVKLNVKQFKIPIFINRLIYSFFRPSKAQRAYQYALRLLEKGFYTPEPVAYILIKKGGLFSQSYFISLQSPYSHTMYEFGKGGITGREDILIDFAHYTARLHGAGILHCDYSPGNILFESVNNKTQFCLIDINRMKFDRPVSVKEGCANFARLWGKEDLFILLAREYAKARNADEELCRNWILYYRDRFWKRFAAKHGIPFEYK